MLLFSFKRLLRSGKQSLVIHPKNCLKESSSTGIPNKDSVILEVELDTFKTRNL